MKPRLSSFKVFLTKGSFGTQAVGLYFFVMRLSHIHVHVYERDIKNALLFIKLKKKTKLLNCKNFIST